MAVTVVVEVAFKMGLEGRETLGKWRWQEREQLQGAFQVHNTEAELCGVRR